jgi:toxin ParE1/3/4
MSLYFLSPQAAQDLADINDYLFASNPDSADAFLTTITEKFELLAKFPNLGWRRDELALGLRSFPFQVYLIFYRTVDSGVEIARVISGYHDLDALFVEE